MSLLSDFAYRCQECFDSFPFADQCHCSGCVRSCSHSRIIVETEKHDCTVRGRGTECGRGCDPIHCRHGEIHEHHIGMECVPA